jgi:hypothetical protein
LFRRPSEKISTEFGRRRSENAVPKSAPWLKNSSVDVGIVVAMEKGRRKTGSNNTLLLLRSTNSNSSGRDAQEETREKRECRP